MTDADVAKNLGWTYDICKLAIPYFITVITLKNDTREDGGIGVVLLYSLVGNYNAITADILKVRDRASSVNHEGMLYHTNKYMTAWMLYHLQGDEEARRVFFGSTDD